MRRAPPCTKAPCSCSCSPSALPGPSACGVSAARAAQRGAPEVLPSLLFYAAMLAATVVVECALVWLAGRGRADRAVVVRTALFLNLCTHPLATLVGSQSGAFLQLEMLVALAEGVGYRYVAGQSWP